MESPKLTIWRLKDSNMGHEKQTQALIQGFEQSHCITVKDFTINHPSSYYLAQWLLRRPIFSSIQPPDIIVGAGHKTHIPMLIAKRQQRCKAVVVMKPSIPQHYFDAIVAPAHDFPKNHPPSNVITTLTALAPSINSQPNPQKGLILLGGASKHFRWDDNNISAAVDNIIKLASNDIQWLISTSRRTPETTLVELNKRFANNRRIEIVDFHQVDMQWLPKQLITAGTIWISNDSASMLAEALNTQAHIGLIPLESKNTTNKLMAASRLLIEQGIVNIDYKIKNPSQTRHPTNEHIECSQKVLNLILPI